MRMKVLNLSKRWPRFTAMTVQEVLAEVMPVLAKEHQRLRTEQECAEGLDPSTALLEVQLHPVAKGHAYLRIADSDDELLGAPWLILPDGATRYSLAPREKMQDLLGPQLHVVRDPVQVAKAAGPGAGTPR